MIKLQIGKNIKKFRSQAGYTQASLAKVLGVSDRTICSWEIDRTEPNMEYVEKMCKVFDCKVSDLTGHNEKYSVDNAHLVAQIRNDARLTEAIKIYFGLSDKKKEKVIEFINLLADD